MRPPRTSNALILAILSSIVALPGFLHAEKKAEDDIAAAKEKAPSERESRQRIPRPAPGERAQPSRERDTGETVTFLGIAAMGIDPAVRAQLDLPAGTGIAVGNIMKDSPAEKSGVQQYDILTKLDDQILVSGEQFQTLVRMKKPGDEVTLTLLRAAKERTIKVKLASHRFPAAALERDFRIQPWKPGQRHGTPPAWDQHAWQEHWKKLGTEWSRNLEAWIEEHGEEWEEALREMLEENLGDPDTWEPRMKKWLEEEMKPQIETHVRKYVQVHATIIDDDGKVVVTMKDGKKHVTATDPKGKTLFEGFCETEAERKKVPKKILEKVDSVKVDVQLDTPASPKKSPPKLKKPSPKKSGGKKDDAV